MASAIAQFTDTAGSPVAAIATAALARRVEVAAPSPAVTATDHSHTTHSVKHTDSHDLQDTMPYMQALHTISER